LRKKLIGELVGADPDINLRAPFMGEAVVLPATWAAVPAFARTAALE
jgi:hypothetical protein